MTQKDDEKNFAIIDGNLEHGVNPKQKKFSQSEINELLISEEKFVIVIPQI